MCQRCKSARIVGVSAKCSDACWVTIGEDKSHDGYVPTDLGIGGGDYLDFTYCLDCGQLAGTFPLAPADLEGGEDE